MNDVSFNECSHSISHAVDSYVDKLRDVWWCYSRYLQRARRQPFHTTAATTNNASITDT